VLLALLSKVLLPGFNCVRREEGEAIDYYLVSIVCAGRRVVQFNSFMYSTKIHSFGVF